MATARSSPSSVSCDRASSTPHDQTSFVSDIELVSLVPDAYNPALDQSWQSSATVLDDTRRSTAYSSKVETSDLHGIASATLTKPMVLQSDRPSVVRRLLLDSWLCEVVAMGFSVGCLAAIVFIVGAYDGERIPQLVSGLTLNAIISVLSTASRAMLIFVVGAIMGQLKWCWLKRSGRQIQDIQTMDDASRGPLGAFGVLSSWTGGSLAALCSAITLLMVAFSPFLQQLVEYPSRNVTQPGAFALAPQNLAYTHHSFIVHDMDATSPWEENVELSHVLEAGIWSITKPFDKEPTCSTGQCSWPEFKSVGWCSKCEDRTYSATISNCKLDAIIQNKNNVSEYCILDLGNGAKFSLLRDLDLRRRNRVDGNFTSALVWPMSYGNSGTKLKILEAPELSSGPSKLMGVLNPLIVMGEAVVELADHSEPETAHDLNFDIIRVVQASQCMLHPCEKTLSLNTTNGTTKWSVESTDYGTLVARNVSLTDPDGPRGNHRGVMALCWQAEDGDLDFGARDEGSYVVDWIKRAFCPVEDYAFEIQKFLSGRYNEEFAVNVGQLGSTPFGFDGGDTMNYYEFKGGRFNTVGPGSSRNLSQRVENLAIALTNYGLQTTNHTVSGKAIAEESYVRVRWQWIALPAFLEVATLVLLILTILHSRHKDVPLWKSSVLALIYHGVDELRGQETFATESLSGMEVTAKSTDVQLVKSENGLNSLSERPGYRQVAQDN